MSAQDRQVYLELLNPDNPAMQAIRHGGDAELQAMYRKDIWDSIRKKHSLLHQQQGTQLDENVFLNSLNEQEYAEFVRNKPADQSIQKYMRSGLASELLQPEKIREKVAYQARELSLLEESKLQEQEDHNLNSIAENEMEIKK